MDCTRRKSTCGFWVIVHSFKNNGGFESWSTLSGRMQVCLGLLSIVLGQSLLFGVWSTALSHGLFYLRRTQADLSRGLFVSVMFNCAGSSSTHSRRIQAGFGHGVLYLVTVCRVAPQFTVWDHTLLTQGEYRLV